MFHEKIDRPLTGNSLFVNLLAIGVLIAGIIQESPTNPLTKRGSNYGIIMVYLTPMQSRERDAEEITVELQKNVPRLKTTSKNLNSVKSGQALHREDWKRSISITADIEEEAGDVSSVTVNRKLIDKLTDIEDRYHGYTVDYEGEFKDTQESVENLVRSFLIAALVIYIILVALFRSLIHPIVIMGVIPLTVVGVIWAFYFHGLPLSFLGLKG